MTQKEGQQNFFAFKALGVPVPTVTPTATPTATPTVAPTAIPTSVPTSTPTSTPIPVNPDDPGQGGTDGGVPPQELPKTGDGADIAMWIGMLAISVAGMVFLISRKGKMFH